MSSPRRFAMAFRIRFAAERINVHEAMIHISQQNRKSLLSNKSSDQRTMHSPMPATKMVTMKSNWSIV